MKKHLIILLILALLLCGCAPREHADIAATTLPMWQFTCRITEGTGLTVTRLVTESVSCLHDYTLTVGQMKAIEGAHVVVMSGAGLEEFLEEALGNAPVIDAAAGIPLLEGGHHHDHEGDAEAEAHHEHEHDPHLWLSPAHAMDQARNICAGLSAIYPEFASLFEENLAGLLSDLQALEDYGKRELSDLQCREIVTFHDGFAYFAEAFSLEAAASIEEDSGSEASAKDLRHITELVRREEIPAVFVERSGSRSAASVIAAETGCGIGELDTVMSGEDYFTAMEGNLRAVLEALS